MIAKILAVGGTRNEARARLSRAIGETRAVIEGGMTNKGFLLDVLAHETFATGGVDTSWLDEVGLAHGTRPAADALFVAAIHAYQQGRAAARVNFFGEASRGRPLNVPPSIGVEVDLVYDGVPYRLNVFAMGGWTYRVYQGARVAQITLLEQGPYSRLLVTRDRRVPVLVSSSAVEIRVEVDGRHHRVERDVGGRVRATSPSLLIEVTVKPGDEVAVGDRLGLFEAMKCETAFHAPLSGTVREVVARAGERLNAGDVILVIEPSDDVAQPGSTKEQICFPDESDPLAAFTVGDDRVALDRANALSPEQRTAAIGCSKPRRHPCLGRRCARGDSSAAASASG
jgi:acetyl/propionyl-CoA carboxylase alpha subunit